MTIQQCRYALEIAATGSFSEAAKQLFVAQSSLSVSIKALEQELGIRIFERSGSGVYLTEEGSEFVRYAARIADSEGLITERYRGSEAVSRLRIATQHYDFIADVFGNFLREVTAERYQLAIKEIETYNVVQEVLTGNSDVGILAIKEGDSDIMRRYLDKKSISFRALLRVPPHVFLRREHPLAAHGTLTYEELSSYPYVSYEQGEHNSSYFTEEMHDSLMTEKQI